MPNIVQRRVALLSDDGKFADSMTPQAVLDAVEHVDQAAAQAAGSATAAANSASAAAGSAGTANQRANDAGASASAAAESAGQAQQSAQLAASMTVQATLGGRPGTLVLTFPALAAGPYLHTVRVPIGA